MDSDCPVKLIDLNPQQAEADLTILGGDSHSRTRAGSPTTLSLPECVDVSQADIIVRSSDHVDFRIHKLILATSSPVFKDMFSLSQPSNNEAVDELPVIQLSEDAELVRALITALYPIPFEIPASYDKILALLAAAQKYDMGTVHSVLTHIRGSLALQDSPFIFRENAFLAYSVARRYGLRKEAIQAARLTLKFTLTIESPEFGDIPGAHLHELWNYHRMVRAQLLSDRSLPAAAAAFNVRNGLNCTRRTWIQTYVQSIIDSPSLFDPIEFQMALARHTTNTNDPSGNSVVGCPYCANIPVETMRIFWTTLAYVVHRCMERVSTDSNYIQNLYNN
ncbi:hypothetical protein EDB85DRAFT_2096544 [Lactarius pseudohatsudake]|nr:hypothetical protein EDB85DRAFT_2096544 [Lactarius pseudohatsudake]